MKFADILKIYREKLNYSYRELGRLSEIDHAYLYRLESGAKESPSSEKLKKIYKALKLNPREVEIFELALEEDIEKNLFSLINKDTTYSIDVVRAAASMSFRGQRASTEEDWKKILDKVKKIYDELE